MEDISSLLKRGRSLYEIERLTGMKPVSLVKFLILNKDRLCRGVPMVDMFVYLHERGCSREEVMEALGVNRRKYYELRTRALTVRGYSVPRQTKMIKFLSLLREGMDVDEIARKMNMSRTLLLQLISRARRRGIWK